MRFPGRKPIYINLSRMFKITVYILTALLLTAQLALTIPGARTVLTFVDRLEGVGDSSGVTTALGEIKLTLDGIEPSSSIDVLQNGRSVMFFYDREISLTVSDNSVIEIDGTSINTPFTVRVSKLSDNIKIENDAVSVEVNSNISILGRIFIK